MFEYAVGHWFQKATEHVLGCVLCSPGCFSLFRGEAIMADNVMRTYTTKSERAINYIQYDQGNFVKGTRVCDVGYVSLGEGLMRDSVYFLG